jgi:hypothetical protein
MRLKAGETWTDKKIIIFASSAESVGEFSFGCVVHHQISVSREGAKARKKQKHDTIESLWRRRNRHWPAKSPLLFFLMKENGGPACAKT